MIDWEACREVGGLSYSEVKPASGKTFTPSGHTHQGTDFLSRTFIGVHRIFIGCTQPEGNCSPIPLTLAVQLRCETEMCFCLIQVSIPRPLWNLRTDDLGSFFGAFAEDAKHNHKNRENHLISFVSDRTWHRRESIGMLRRLVSCLTLLFALPCFSLQIRSLVLAARCEEPCPERASVLRRLLRQRTTSQCWCQMRE